ncbi:MAG TPA: Asp-tRNA(Asn)/Glu-tRNA(Gln) amidotransferase subunit GatC [Candidatus Limnocylindria bacterium]|nr:Asp-tRNA(Asn)/Glu-tRNA(Gln) amidotransferase subunit GatC [Candidatus Limnocylindria bacterium]
MLSRQDVEHVARLSRLALGDAEIEKMREQLAAILTHIDTLRALDTEQVEPTSHAVPMENVMREDEPRASLSQAAMLANAPDRSADFFRVPRIIED